MKRGRPVPDWLVWKKRATALAVQRAVLTLYEGYHVCGRGDPHACSVATYGGVCMKGYVEDCILDENAFGRLLGEPGPVEAAYVGIDPLGRLAVGLNGAVRGANVVYLRRGQVAGLGRVDGGREALNAAGCVELVNARW